MQHLKRGVPFILVLMVMFGNICEGSWTLDGQIWSSPYEQGEIFLSQLSVSLKAQEHFQATLAVPIQFTRTLERKGWEYPNPSLAVSWTPPIDEVFSADLRARYHLRTRTLELQGGVHMLLDPIILRWGLSYHGKDVILEGSVVFAANERWALGAHLQYKRNSIVTYELHHTSKSGKHRQLSYSRSLDGSLQCLGIKIAL